MSTYRTRRGRTRMGAMDWWIAINIALPWTLFLGLLVIIWVFG